MSDVMTTQKAAWKLFEQGYNCAQAVFPMLPRNWGWMRKRLKIASGFAAVCSRRDVRLRNRSHNGSRLKVWLLEPNDSIGSIANEKPWSF